MTSSVITGFSSNRLDLRPYPRSTQALSWNPITNLAFSKNKDRKFGLWRKETRRMQFEDKTKRKSFMIYANVVPGVPLPSTPPPSGSMKGWLIGIVISLVLPFFTNKWGPLWVVKNRIENAVQTVENVVEYVEKVAEGVDKIAEEISHELPQGKLKDIVEFVEHAAEKTAQTAGSIDNIIDKVQEAEEQVECIVESIAKEAKNTAPILESASTEAKIKEIELQVEVEAEAETEVEAKVQVELIVEPIADEAENTVPAEAKTE